MSRRKNPARPAEPTVQKLPTRVPRRKRRKPSGVKSMQQASAKTQPRDNVDVDYSQGYVEAALPKLSRAPRSAEPPPSNPNVFSYTFTIWKST
jgi:hypothetical protein